MYSLLACCIGMLLDWREQESLETVKIRMMDRRNLRGEDQADKYQNTFIMPSLMCTDCKFSSLASLNRGKGKSVFALFMYNVCCFQTL